MPSVKTHKKCQVVIWKMPTVRNANWQDRRRRGRRSGDRALSLGASDVTSSARPHKNRIQVLIAPNFRYKDCTIRKTLRNEIFCWRPRSGVTKRPKLFWIHLLFCRILNWLNYLIEVSYCMQEPVETS